MKKCPVKIRKVGMTGESYGAYYTLACVSVIPEITCCIPMCGYDFIVEASVNVIRRTHHAPFSYKGKDVPYAGAKTLENIFGTIRDFKHTPGYKSNQILQYYYEHCFNDRSDAARIKVENSNADFLFMSHTWNSALANKRMDDILTNSGYPHRHIVKVYENGSHAIGWPGMMDNKTLNKPFMKFLIKKIMPYEIEHHEDCERATGKKVIVICLIFYWNGKTNNYYKSTITFMPCNIADCEETET